jgi:hypothetical protein
MTSPRPTDLNFALPPGFVPTVRPVPAPAPVRKAAAPAVVPPVRRIEAAPRISVLRTVEAPAPVPVIETAEPVAEPKPRAPRKPRATTPKAVAPEPEPRGPRTARITTTPKPALDEVVEHEAGRILEDAARTAADMLAAARRTAVRLGAELAAEHEQRRRDMEDAVADLADHLDELAHRLRTGASLPVR